MTTPDSAPFTSGGDSVRWINIEGRGDPVLFLHGWGCHGAASWADSAARLGRRAVIVDLPGHGRSDRPHDFDYSLTSLTAAVHAVVAAVGEGPLDIVSHSLGGTLAILLADEHPGSVRRSVLVEPAIDRRGVQPGDIAAWSETDFLRRGWEQMLAEELPWRRADVRLADPLALLRSAVHLTEALGDTVHERLLRTTAPTLLVRGAARRYDREADFSTAGIQEVVVPGAQHFVMLDAPDAFAEILADAFSDDT